MLAVAFAAGWGPLHAPLRDAGFDLWQRLLPRERINDGVIVVAIDDASVAAVGQSPWPRARVAELLRNIGAAQPAAVGLNIFFAEPDRLAPGRLEAELGAALGAPLSEAARAALAALPDADQDLAAALAGGPIALAVAGLDEPDAARPPIAYRAQVLARGGDPAPHLHAYPGMLGSIAPLQSAAAGHGATNAPTGADGVLRSLPALVRIGDSTTPALALELLRLAAHQPRVEVQLDGGGLRAVEAGGRPIPTGPNGDWWLHFSEPAQRPVIPAMALLGDPAEAQAVLRGRIVLVGYTAHGLQDLVQTPHGRMAGVAVQAEAIDNAIDERLLMRPRWAVPLEAGATLLLALAAGLASRSPPRWVLLGGLVATVLGVSAGAAAFVGAGLMIDITSPLLAGWLALGAGQALSLGEAQWQRRQLRQALQDSREAAARSEGELDAARRIQLGMLPDAAAVLGDEPRVALAAAMQSARQVGGDLYDFFLPAPGQLFFLIGDVSGKGVPASLFMALSKVMIRGEALRGGRFGNTLRDERLGDVWPGGVQPGDVPVGDAQPADVRLGEHADDAPPEASPGGALPRAQIDDTRPGESPGDAPAAVLSRAAVALARENAEALFVTVFAGRLDLQTGTLDWCAAGHDLPYLQRPDGGRAVRLRGAVGPPLTVADADYAYPGHRLQLQPGDGLLLYSDGLTDMDDPAGERFGHTRLARCLDGLPDGAAPQRVLEALQQAVAGHADSAEPADDLALLVLRWHGPSGEGEARDDIRSG